MYKTNMSSSPSTLRALLLFQTSINTWNGPLKLVNNKLTFAIYAEHITNCKEP